MRAKMLYASIALWVFLSFPGSGLAQKLGVGFYAPEVTMNLYERFNYIQGLALHLSQKLEKPVQGLAYKSERDFRRDWKSKKIQFAILGGFLLASQSPGPILAYATLNQKLLSNWSLLCKNKSSLRTLKGKVLQLPSLGPLVYGLIQNGLLGGNLIIRTHFKIIESPDLTSAIEAVRLGQAQVVFAPINTSGLTPLIANSLPISSPGFVALDSSLSNLLTKQIKEGLLTYKGTVGTIVGWGGSNIIDYSRFASLAQKHLPRMEMLPIPLERLRQNELVDGQSVTYELPPIEDLFKIP